MLRTEDKSQRQRHVYISSRTYARRSRTPQLQEIVLSARETSVSPPQVVSELVNSPRAVGCGFSHFSTACRRFYCSSGRHFASSRRKSTPSRYFVYGPRPVSAARDLLCNRSNAGIYSGFRVSGPICPLHTAIIHVIKVLEMWGVWNHRANVYWHLAHEPPQVQDYNQVVRDCSVQCAIRTRNLKPL